MPFEFKKAERKLSKLRLALCAPAGAGKTFSALKIAQGLGGKIAMIDTEHGSGSLYADTTGMPEYAILELDPPFSPGRYIDVIGVAEKAGFDIIIIDSLSHAWSGEGGVLEMQENARAASKSGNSWAAWREVTPQHNALVDKILQSKCHVIATMRSKQEYAQVVEDGKTTIKKLGLAPVQREGMDYEFTVVLDLSQEHIATSSKDRTSLFDGQHFKPSTETGKTLLNWLNTSKPEVPKTTPEQRTAMEAKVNPVQQQPQTEDPEQAKDFARMESATSPSNPATGDTPGNIKIDMDWLKSTLERLKYQTTIYSYIGSLSEMKGIDTKSKDIQKVIGQMTPQQQEILVKKLQERAELSGVKLD